MSTPDIIPTTEAAAIVGVSVATINRWAAEGKLTPVAKASGLTGARFYLRHDVIALADERRSELLAALPGGAA